MTAFYVTLSEKDYEEVDYRVKESILPGKKYEVLGSVNDKILLLGEKNHLIEVYSRRCRFAGFVPMEA